MSDFGRVVFDTSTLVSAALRVGSVPHRALSQALLQAELCASQATLDELDKVLMRAKFDRYLPHEVRREFVDLIRLASALFVVSDSQVADVQPPCRDPKDHPFLALTQVCEAKVLVSSDADLLALHPLAERTHLDTDSVPGKLQRVSVREEISFASRNSPTSGGAFVAASAGVCFACNEETVGGLTTLGIVQQTTLPYSRIRMPSRSRK